jgi:hypothetical protein
MSVQMVVIAVALVLSGIAIGRLLSAWLKYRGRRVVRCPENSRPAGVTVDTRHVVATALGRPDLRLSSCSRWPEREGCGQACLGEILAAPEDCLVRNILTKWYEGKTCVSCGRPIGDISAGAAKPAVIRADSISVEWSEIPAEQLEETLSAARPICFACHMASKMVREHQELVIDRSKGTVRHIS